MAMRPAKKRRITPPQSDDDNTSSQRSEVKVQKAFFKSAASWDLEQDYETKARKGKNNKKEKESSRLPIRLPDGRLQHVAATTTGADLESDEDWLEGRGEDDGSDEEEIQKEKTAAPAKPEIPEPQQIFEAKEELAKLASSLNENPEENVGAFKAIAKIGQSRIPAIQQLVLATQLAVYKDVIPGYRIRPISEDGPEEKLSKEVRKLRTYEQSLVSSYQVYVKDLTRHAKSGGKQQHGENNNNNNNSGSNIKRRGQHKTVASIAITCACTLLTTVPHFNFRSDLIKILVGKLSTRRVDDDFRKCLAALETLFLEDEEGRPAMEAVSLLSKMMRAREYRVDESVMNLFLHLRLLSEFAGKASTDAVEHEQSAATEAEREMRKKKYREFRTKRARKSAKEQKALQRDLAQADAIVSHEERDRLQSETLKLVFASYFRILKVRRPNLMGAVLEGLARYAHLINQDFFGDLLEALKDLIRHSEEDAEGRGEGEEGDGVQEDEEEEDDEETARNTTREALLCTVTAFALLAGQDAHNARSDLHLDLSFFTTHLWQTLLPLSLNPDLELGAKSLHLPDPNSKSSATASTSSNKINLQTTTVLLIRSLTAILIPPWNIRSVPPLRLAAFTKQLMSASLHVPEKSAQAVLALLADVMHTHGRKVSALWNTEERRGDGVYNPVLGSSGAGGGGGATVEASNPFAATVWEGELLRRHYCPKVREGVKIVEKGVASAAGGR